MKSKNSSLIKGTLFIGVLVFAALYAVWLNHHTSFKPTSQTEFKLQAGTYISQEKDLTPFQLRATTGGVFNNSNLKNHWTFVFFGFTHCPNICPTTMSTLSLVYEKLAQIDQKNMPQFIFVSIDPKRDTLARIATYLNSFNTKFIGATGTNENLTEITTQLGIMFSKQTSENLSQYSTYNMDHSGQVMLFNPKGYLQAVFSMPHKATSIANDFQKIIEHYQTT